MRAARTLAGFFAGGVVSASGFFPVTPKSGRIELPSLRVCPFFAPVIAFSFFFFTAA